LAAVSCLSALVLASGCQSPSALLAQRSHYLLGYTDSRWVYYTSKVGQAVELMRASLEGEVQQLTRSKPGVLNYQPKTSPDGKLVVFGSTRDGARALYVANADGRAVRAITLPVKGRSQMHPHWRPQPHTHYS